MYFFSGGKECGSRCDGLPERTRPFVKGARGDGTDAKAKGIAIYIGSIGSGKEFCVGDFFEGIFCGASDGGNSGECGYVVNGSDAELNLNLGGGGKRSIVGGDGEGV